MQRLSQHIGPISTTQAIPPPGQFIHARPSNILALYVILADGQTNTTTITKLVTGEPFYSGVRKSGLRREGEIITREEVLFALFSRTVDNVGLIVILCKRMRQSSVLHEQYV